MVLQNSALARIPGSERERIKSEMLPGTADFEVSLEGEQKVRLYDRGEEAPRQKEEWHGVVQEYKGIKDFSVAGARAS